jgi:hypothetical protein
VGDNKKLVKSNKNNIKEQIIQVNKPNITDPVIDTAKKVVDKVVPNVALTMSSIPKLGIHLANVYLQNEITLDNARMATYQANKVITKVEKDNNPDLIAEKNKLEAFLNLSIDEQRRIELEYLGYTESKKLNENTRETLKYDRDSPYSRILAAETTLDIYPQIYKRIKEINKKVEETSLKDTKINPLFINRREQVGSTMASSLGLEMVFSNDSVSAVLGSVILGATYKSYLGTAANDILETLTGIFKGENGNGLDPMELIRINWATDQIDKFTDQVEKTKEETLYKGTETEREREIRRDIIANQLKVVLPWLGSLLDVRKAYDKIRE